MDKKLATRLKKAKNNWAGARERVSTSGDGEWQELPDGRYLARPTAIDVGESQSSGRLQAAWTWTVADGEFEGQTSRDYDGLETEDNLFYLGKKLARLGYELPDDLMDIEEVFADITKTSPLCRIRLKTKGEFQNLYIDKVLDDGDGDGDAGDPDDDGDGGEEEVSIPKKSGQKKKEPEPDPEPDKDGDDDEGDEDGDDDEPDEDGDDDEDDEDGDDDEPDEAQVEVGMPVQVDRKDGTTSPGTILEVLENEGKVRVKLDDTGKVLRVTPDKLSIVTEESAPPEKPKGRKKQR